MPNESGNFDESPIEPVDEQMLSESENVSSKKQINTSRLPQKKFSEDKEPSPLFSDSIPSSNQIPLAFDKHSSSTSQYSQRAQQQAIKQIIKEAIIDVDIKFVKKLKKREFSRIE